MSRRIAASLVALVVTACPGRDRTGIAAPADASTGPGLQPGQVGPRFPGGGEGVDEFAGAEILCFYADDLPGMPAASIEHALESAVSGAMLHVRLTLDPRFADNTYGLGSIGWEREREGVREFSKLVGSDHALLALHDAAGDLAMALKIDYISADASRPSGFGTLGVAGGDGAVNVGDPAAVRQVSTSLDRNLNERGYSSYTTDSPLTDPDYTPNADAPSWDYRVVYEAWLEARVFDAAGFGWPDIDTIHASPSKLDDNTLEVTPGPCPPEWYGCTEERLEDCPPGGGWKGSDGGQDAGAADAQPPQCSEEHPEGCP